MRRTLQFLFALLLSFVVAQQPNFDPTKTTLTGPGTQGSQAADGMQLYITAKDSDGNLAPCMNVAFYTNFVITLVNTQDPNLKQTVYPASCTSSVYLATYVGPTQLGIYSLTAGFLYPNSTLVQFVGSPVNITAAAGSINPPSCIGNPPATATAGEDVVFNVTTYDKYGNVNKTCLPDNYWAIRLSGSGKVYQGSIKSCDNGLYSIQINAQATARYTLSVTIFGQNIKNSPFPVVVNPGALDPASTTVTGDLTAATAGVNAILVITARDKFGNAITACDSSPFSNWTIDFNGSLNITGSIDSCSSGVYQAHYFATVAKTYTYSLKYNGQSIASSPYTTTVSPNPTISPLNSYPSGDPLNAAIAGQTKQYQINVFDAYGNEIHACNGLEPGWAFSMVMVNDPNTKCTNQPQFSNCFPESGYFTVLYTCELAGNYTLTNSYNSQTIKSGQFVVLVQPAPIAPQQCKANGTGLSVARAGVATYFDIITYDQYNNKISLCEPAPYSNWRASLSLGGYSFFATVVSCTSGVYTFQYTLNMTGSWTLIVNYNNQFVVQPYWTVAVIPGPPAPGGCIASGAGISGTEAGVPANFNVTCSDSFSNPLSLCTYFDQNQWNALFVLQGSSYNFSGVFSYCTNATSPLAPAITAFSYSNTKAGTYDLKIYYSSIMATPVYNPVITPGDFDPLNSYAEGPGVESQSLVAGDQTKYSIIAADKYGNKLDTCSMDQSKISATYNPAVTGFNITGCDAGVTTAIYTPTRAGNLTVIITYAGNQIRGDPYYPNVIAGPTDAGFTVAQGTPLYNGSAGVVEYFYIQAYDRFNNPAACIDTTNFAAVMSLAGVTSQGVILNCTNGLYTASYQVYIAGIWQLDITYRGTPIRDSPFHPYIGPGPVKPSTCVASPSVLNLQAGVTGYFTIVCGDGYNNNVTTCGGQIAFSNSTLIKSQTCQAGVYNVSTSSTNAGVYVQNITFNSIPISNQVTINVVPGPINTANTYLQALNTYPVGVLSYYYVYPLDQYGNPISDCTLTFKTNINGTATVPTNLVSCGNAVFTYGFNVTVIGTYQIYVTYNDVNIQKSPAPFSATAGPIYPANSNVSVLKNVTAGQNGTFVVNTFDVFGNRIQACLNSTYYYSWVVTIVQEANNFGVVTSCSNGVYTGTFVPYKAGPENLRVSIDGQNVGGPGYSAPYYVFAANPSNNSIARPVDGFVGTSTTWPIDAYDAFGNQVTTCIDGVNFVVKILSNGTSVCTGTSDCSAGNYSGHYTCNVAGTFDVLVTLNSQSIVSIPPKVNVQPGGPDDSKTKAYGPGVSPTPTIPAGNPTYFVIVAQDSFGNQASKCPDYKYNITFDSDPKFIAGPNQVCTSAGNTTVSYTATKAGKYNINIYGVNGTNPISGNPYSVNIVAGDLDPRHITNASAILDSGAVGQLFRLPLVVRDKYDNPIPGCNINDTANFDVTFDASDSDYRYNGYVTCEANSYIVYYQANKTDTYTLTVLYENQHVDFSPYPNIHIGYGDPDFSQSYAVGPGVEAKPVPAGAWNNFTIYLVNKYGYNITYCITNVTSKFNWKITIASPTVTPVYGYCTADFGLFFNFNATVATKYKVDISANNVALKNNANYYALTIPGQIYPPYTQVDIPYNTTVLPYDGYFYIIAEDRFHNPVINYDGKFTAILEPTCANTTVKCVANNTREVNCSYTVAYGGVYCVDIFYDDNTFRFFASFPELEATQIVRTGINLDIIGGSACTDGCNNQGVCVKPNVCSCWTNRTGDACEFTHSSKYMKLGLAIGLIIGLAIAFFIIGILIGYCIFKYLNRGGSSDTPLLH